MLSQSNLGVYSGKFYISKEGQKRGHVFFLKLKKYNNNSKTDYIEAHKQKDRNDALKLDSASLLQLEI